MLEIARLRCLIEGKQDVSTSNVQVADEQTKKYLTLLELSKAIASHRELSQLFHDLACRLKTLFDFTHLGVLLHDDTHDVLKLHIVESCEPTLWQAPTEVPMAGSIA